MAAVLGPLELDDDQVRIGVYAEKINAPAAVHPFAKFLGDDQQPLPEHVDVIPQESLNAAPFIDSLGAERRHFDSPQLSILDLENRHRQAAAMSAESMPLTSILPVTAAEIRAARRSWRRVIAVSASFTSASFLAIAETRWRVIAICSAGGGTGTSIESHASMRSAFVP